MPLKPTTEIELLLFISNLSQPSPVHPVYFHYLLSFNTSFIFLIYTHFLYFSLLFCKVFRFTFLFFTLRTNTKESYLSSILYETLAIEMPCSCIPRKVRQRYETKLKYSRVKTQFDKARGIFSYFISYHNTHWSTGLKLSICLCSLERNICLKNSIILVALYSCANISIASFNRALHTFQKTTSQNYQYFWNLNISPKSLAWVLLVFMVSRSSRYQN